MHSKKAVLSALFAGVLAVNTSLSSLAAETGKVTASKLNVRDAASYDSNIIETIDENSEVNIIGWQDGWYQINHKGLSAYVRNEYISVYADSQVSAQNSNTEETKYVKVNTSVLNVRSAASFTADIISKAVFGQRFEILSESGDFYCIDFYGRAAYVAKDYTVVLTKQQVEEILNAPLGQKIVDYAMQYLGTPYAYGGASPSGFDCSGLAYFVYNQFGINIGRSSYDQMAKGSYVSKEELQPGDVLVFSGYAGGSSADHIGIYVGDGKMIHSPRKGYTVCIDDALTGWFGSRYVTARRMY